MNAQAKGALWALLAAGGLGIAPSFAQSWAWAVYHDDQGTIMVANMADISASSGWQPLPPYTHQGLRQAQQAACLLVLQGDLATRRYSAPQIERGEWHC